MNLVIVMESSKSPVNCFQMSDFSTAKCTSKDDCFKMKNK